MSAIFGETLVIDQENGPPIELVVWGDEFYVRYETKDAFGETFETQTEFVVAGDRTPLALPALLRVCTLCTHQDQWCSGSSRDIFRPGNAAPECGHRIPIGSSAGWSVPDLERTCPGHRVKPTRPFPPVPPARLVVPLYPAPW